MPYFTNKGRVLYYYSIGKGEPIFFIHGLLGSSWKHWRYQLRSESLFSQYHLISYDIRGFGLSSNKIYEAPKTKEIVLDTYIFLNNVLKIDKPLIIIGYSVGAALALVYTLLFPKKIKGLVLLSPIPFMFSTIQSYGISNFKLKKTLEASDFFSILTDLVWNRIKKHNRLFLHRVSSQLNENPNNLLRRIKSLCIPILLIYGTGDSIVPQETFYLLEKYLPEHCIIEKVSFDHGIAHEHPKFFNSRLLDFLGK
ncbi:MAG: alpha/beta fold hydrolase, partial [Candidatus Hodarchaeota archaeon]